MEAFFYNELKKDEDRMEIDFKFDISKVGEKFLNKGLVEYNVGYCDYFAKHKYGRLDSKKCLIIIV